MSLEIIPCSLTEANAFVLEHHRNHKPCLGHKFSFAVTDGEKIVGVAITGRPVSRHADDGLTLEVNRCCTDGTRNACSILYRHAWKAARAMGYRKLITYTLPSEGGASLRGAGFKLLGSSKGGNWNVQSRPRIDSHLQQEKFKWQIAEPSKALSAGLGSEAE